MRKNREEHGVTALEWRPEGLRAMTGDIVLCSWERHFTLSASLQPGV